MTPNQVTIEFGPLNGSGLPPAWHFRISDPDGGTHAQMSGPRILVLESLRRYVEIFTEESAPDQPGRV